MPTTTQPHVATPEVEEALSNKMAQLALKEKEQQTERSATQSGLGYINLVGFPIGPETITLIPQADAVRLGVVCFLRTPGEIRLGALNPDNPAVQQLVKHISETTHANVEMYFISQHSLEAAWKLYERLPKIRSTKSGIQIAEDDIRRFQEQIHDLREINDHLSHTSITDVFSVLIAGAIQARSSDIHIETEENAVRVRYRIDGVLTPIATLPKELWPRVISRIKLLAGLKLNITTAPQDGRITIYLPHDQIDVRVSTLPTAFGESVVMRLLQASAATITLEDLGLRGRTFEQLKEEILKPNGLIIVTGPTGSGKTTTLYAILNRLNQTDVKIITLEDPIEYKIPGINQSQVDNARDYTFGNGLRSILRQDPDVVMVGEIRDLDTAETSIQGALTGHLVLSTVHTNDAAGAIPRFLSLGAKPYLLAPALNTVVGQRLVRRLCPDCKTEVKLDEKTMARIRTTLGTIPASIGSAVAAEKPLKFYHGPGCDKCHGIGYRGRVGIFELLLVNDQVEQLIISSRVTEYTMREIAAKQGMITMVQDGLLKALDGITSVDEVFRVAA